MLKEKSLKFLGFILLLLTVLFMVASSILIQNISSNSGYNKAFNFSYYNYSLLVVLIPFNYIKKYISGKCSEIKDNKKGDKENKEDQEESSNNYKYYNKANYNADIKTSETNENIKNINTKLLSNKIPKNNSPFTQKSKADTIILDNSFSSDIKHFNESKFIEHNQLNVSKISNNDSNLIPNDFQENATDRALIENINKIEVISNTNAYRNNKKPIKAFLSNNAILEVEEENDNVNTQIYNKDNHNYNEINDVDSSDVSSSHINKDFSLEEYNKQFHLMCIYLAVLWYLGNCFYNLSIMTTSISSANTLSNSSIVFILTIKILYLKSSCSIYRILGLIIISIALGGLFWVDSGNSSSKKSSIIGDFYSILGALIYSVFALYLKQMYKKFKNHLNLVEVFGFIGLYTIFVIPLFLIFLHLTGLERCEIPNKEQYCYILINAFIGTILCDLLQNYSNILLSPHIVSFGLTLTIPVSYIWDVLNHNVIFEYRFVVIGVLTVIAFSLIIYEKYLKIIKKEEMMKRNMEIDRNRNVNSNNNTDINKKEVRNSNNNIDREEEYCNCTCIYDGHVCSCVNL